MDEPRNRSESAGSGATLWKRDEDSAPPGLAAAEVVEGVIHQMSGLEALAEQLERTLGGSLCSCQEISSDTIRSLQNADFIRQSARDMRAILTGVAPHVCWRDGYGLSLAELRGRVQMQGSVPGPEGRHGPAEAHDDGDDIWL